MSAAGLWSAMLVDLLIRPWHKLLNIYGVIALKLCTHTLYLWFIVQRGHSEQVCCRCSHGAAEHRPITLQLFLSSCWFQSAQGAAAFHCFLFACILLSTLQIMRQYTVSKTHKTQNKECVHYVRTRLTWIVSGCALHVWKGINLH